MGLIFKKIYEYGNLVMFSHVIFSLSFAVVSILLASEGKIYPEKYFYAFIALLCGRTGANAINRVIDNKFDGLNPRTKDRNIPSGTVTIKEGIILSVICFIGLFYASFKLSYLCALLSPIALFFLVTYSYTKRFTFLCHYYLGITTSIAPVGAYIAITGKFDSIIPFILAGANILWVAGFDIIYGTQDYDFDIKTGLHSMATKVGIEKALIIAKVSHILAIIILISLTFFTELLGIIYLCGVLLLFILLIIEHSIVKPSFLKKVNIAVYSFNKIFSLVFMLISVIDIYI